MAACGHPQRSSQPQQAAVIQSQRQMIDADIIRQGQGHVWQIISAKQGYRGTRPHSRRTLHRMLQASELTLKHPQDLYQSQVRHDHAMQKASFETLPDLAAGSISPGTVFLKPGN